MTTPMQLRFVSRMARVALAMLVLSLLPQAWAVDAPKVVQKDGRFTLMVEGKPYLVLGGQIHNSSAWPSELAQVWDSMAALHGNTVEAPVYWEQMEPQPGQFNFSNVDALVDGARAHNLHVVLLWFGTWKNGNNHYTPSWVKNDTKRFPRIIRPNGEPIDVLSPLGQNTLNADKAAFTALMRHLKQIDSERHTVLMVQVENESGNIGSVRDNSPAANKLFTGPVPNDMLAATRKQPGTWMQVFPGEADEIFQTYYQARYMNEIASAGKAEFAIPLYVNVWLNYPPPLQPQLQLDMPGIDYPSGGPWQKYVGLWKALAPCIDVIGPDMYTDDTGFFLSVADTYKRPDNPLFIPEVGRDDSYGKFFWYALGQGAIGFSPFGVDQTGWNILGDQAFKSHPYNFALVSPMMRDVAQYSFDGKVKTAVEVPGTTSQDIDLGGWQVTASFGFPQADGRRAPGTKDAHGAALIIQLGPDDFLVTGIDVSITFHLPNRLPWWGSEIVTAEQGVFENGVWKSVRLWNGDETDRGLCFYQKPEYVKVHMGRF